jgi:aldehyde dehydrogenase (NAD+)
MTSASKPQPNLIGGEWVTRTEVTENRNPSDVSDIIGTYSQASADDVDRAVGAAAKAAPDWARFSTQQRADFLERIGTTILARRDELGRLLSREEGKTLPEGVGEVVRAGQIFRFFSGEALRIHGIAAESVRYGVEVETRREPLGVVGLITPWNFPAAIPAWKIAPALAFGNAVVVKPADLTPGSLHALAEIAVECGCPPGVFNLVMGRGSIVGQALINHPDVAAVSFTGSVEVGRGLIRLAGERQLKMQAEMGGKNASIVMADCDLEVAVPACINAAFGSTGQRCTATSRLIVDRLILHEFTDRFIAATRSLRVGHALDERTQMGPVVSGPQLESNLAAVRQARTEGAEVLGGSVLERPTKGFFQEPAVFLRATNRMQTSRNEIFGPCVSVIAAEGFDEAINLLNDSPFGLSAGIFTRTHRTAREFLRKARAGLAMVNLPTAGVDYHVPFGGSKASSFGPREQGHQAIEFYTQTKTAYILA